MLLHSLDIDRPSSYSDEPIKPLRGSCTLRSTMGEMKITLSPTAIGRILSVISDEVAATAKATAKAVPQAMQSSSNEHLLIGNVGGADDTTV